MESRAESRSQPEILPPGPLPDAYADQHPGYAPGSSPYPGPVAPRPRRPAWQIAPATFVLLGINIAVFVLMVFSGVSPTSPTVLQLLHWGGNAGLVQVAPGSPVIGVLAGEWWRLVTATFVHAGILHLALNMWCLYNLGILGESLLGSAGVVATYLVTGVVGNLLSIAVNPGAVGVGASGAVFGIAGVLIPLLSSKLLPFDPREVKRLRRSVYYFAFLNFALGFGSDMFSGPVQIDNMAHLGGFLSGVLLGFPLVPKLGSDRGRWIRQQWIAFGGALLVIVLAARFLSSFFRS